MKMSTARHEPIQLPNEHLSRLQADFLFHLGISLDDSDVLAKFQEVKFVCIGGTAGRMQQLAIYLKEEINFRVDHGGNEDFDYSFTNERYSGFKTGPILCVNHGIGTPSLSVMLHEIFKLLHKAQCSDVTLIRVGTCGGVGVSAGSVVVTTGCLSAGMEQVYYTSSLGKPLKLPTTTDLDLAQALYDCKTEEDGFSVTFGMTYCADDFYQGQGRLDGSFCDYTEKERREFLTTLKNRGVRNIEMESAGVLAMAHKVGIKAAVVSVVIVDRCQSDLPSISADELKDFEESPFKLVSRYIEQRLSQKEDI